MKLVMKRQYGWKKNLPVTIGPIPGGGEYGNYATAGGKKTLSQGKLSDAFHVYSILWNERKITWFLDGVQFHEIDISPQNLSEFRKPHFLLFNLAVGGKWPGNPDGSTSFPQQMAVDYIRVFQEN
jgi:beta-glucanase (GH16 family)